ncbi:MAG: NAD(P)/FAD-dependent oxidoreductase [Spirosomataceae bacterium]
MQHIVIIGNGISGITAARHIRKLSDHKITIISGETDHFFSRTALMYVYMGHMKFEHTKPYEDDFWAKNRIELVRAWVTNIDFENKKLLLDTQTTIAYDKLILALGSKPNKFGWKGHDLKGVQGLYSYQDLESLENHTSKIKHAVVVGGGLIGIELAEMLLSRGITVTFLVREDSFWNNVLPTEESEMINRHIREHHVDLRLSEELGEIIGDKSGEVEAVITKSGEKINCQFVGLTVGVSPNINLLNSSSEKSPLSIEKDLGATVATVRCNRGILVNEYLETNQKDVYAIGDCAEHANPASGRRAIEQIWYTGRIMGETVAQTICRNPTKYNPGVFFNSAKFFDIEYQTYGQVPAQTPDGIKSFYWQNTDKKLLVRINYNTENQAVVGMNTFGIRMRHEIWDDWIKAQKTIDFVLENLPKANFDPEFFKQYESEILEKYNSENGTNFKLKAKKGILNWF